LLSLLVLYDSTNYFDSYVAKTYYKTASMISLGCRGVALIMGLDKIQEQRALFDFGANLGIAFQIHDDILDFTQSEAQLGKPAFNDLKEGIVTAPIIYALLEQ
jgi:geranylgeranyl pyrophosphate synthase